MALRFYSRLPTGGRPHELPNLSRITLALPFAMPAFAMAYAYADLFDVAGDLRIWMRASAGFDLAIDLRSLPGYGAGRWCVQDRAAQRIVPLLDPQPGERVLDACAAPGGKTAHLLERADLDLLALDVDPRRCERIQDTLARLGLHAQVRCADAARPADWWDGRAFDAILLDAPCTASGIVRRHPDVRWLRRSSDVDALVTTQRALLESLWPLLKPGGRLVYATCSVFRAEGSEQVRSFLVHHTDAVLQPSPGHLLPGKAGLPGEFNDNPPGGYDGFFYACIDKAPP